MTQEFRTRQAPSPTGYLHLGTARQMLFTKLFAAKNNGVWYIRIEDTDRSRLQPDSVKNLLHAMEGLNLLPDEGVTLKETPVHNEFYDIYQQGDYGPYIQSERLGYYHRAAQDLIDKKLAYWNYLTPEQKEELQNFKKITKAPIDYLKANKEKYPDIDLYANVSEILDGDHTPALMYNIQRDEKITCNDELLGKSDFDLALQEDFVILKSDGFPTYHLAFAVDDHLMKTSLIIRAQEWYPSMPKHVTLFSDLWGAEHLPQFIHLPVILGETGNKKMSKRDGNVNMTTYIDNGYLAESLVNYLAFLGWNPGTEKELYLTPEEINTLAIDEKVHTLTNNILPEFTMENISKSSARYNLEKLNWFNREYIKMMNSDTFYDTVTNYINTLKSDIETTHEDDRQKNLQEILDTITNNLGEVESLDTDLAKKAFKLDQNRITTLNELGSESKCILNWQPPAAEDTKWRKISIEESQANLQEIGEFIADQWDTAALPLDTAPLSYVLEGANSWETILKSWLKDNNKDVGSYLWPLRVCLSGLSRSPSPFEILTILDKDEVLRRISTCV